MAKTAKGYGSSHVYNTGDIIEMLEKHEGAVYAAASELGCHYQTILRRAKKQKSIKAAIERYRIERTEIAEAKLGEAIVAGEKWAVLFQLRTQGKDLGYVERQEVINMGDLQEMVDALMESVRKNVPDKDVRERIQEDFLRHTER